MQSPIEGSTSTVFNMEHVAIDLSPGSSKQCNCLGSPISLAKDVAYDETWKENLDTMSLHSIESFVCRICHNSENPENLVSPCLCKGSLTYVHIHCLERWISTSRCTSCELCQFQYNTQQTLRYSLFESLRIWYSRSMSRRALQEDCQMFSLLTLVAFGLIVTLLVAVEYYIMQGNASKADQLWTKGWLIFLLITTLAVYLVNVYLIAKTQLTPWYRWWQSARDIRLILENRKAYPGSLATRGQMHRQHQQSVMEQTSAAQMPMDQTGKSTSGQLANDTACHNASVQSSLPQDTDAATTAAVADSRIFLPINSYSNKTNGSKALNAPYDNGKSIAAADDVAVIPLPPYYCNKNAKWQLQLRRATPEDAVTDEANSKSMSLATTGTATGKRIFCEAASTKTTGIATAISIALSFDATLACGYGMGGGICQWYGDGGWSHHGTQVVALAVGGCLEQEPSNTPHQLRY